MYNALNGLGGSGQVDPTVAANGNVALLSCTAATALFVAGPLFSLIGPRLTFLLGGWTYALYSGSLLNLNHTENAAFVIGAAAILGIGASFLWVVQGAIMTSYVPEAQKGRAIAVFWIIFNLGGGVGSLASFGLNYGSTSGSVNDGTYIALMVLMLFGWVLGLFICSPKRIRLAQLVEAEEKEKHTLKHIAITSVKTMAKWRVVCMLPLFFSANVFYSYQQNYVNGETFNIRTRSLNGALYWIAQMLGGLVIGFILDLPFLSRPNRARVGWAFLLATGMAIWGGGYAFQIWENRRLAQGKEQDIDYTDSSISVGPIFLYIFYGCYDALWQGFAYWLMGTESNSAERMAVLVGSYKTFQVSRPFARDSCRCVRLTPPPICGSLHESIGSADARQAAGAAMAFRLTAIGKPALTQFGKFLQIRPLLDADDVPGMNWGLCIGSLIIVLPTVWTVSETSRPDEQEEVEMDRKDKQDVEG